MRDLNTKEIEKLGESELKYIGILESSKKVLIYECEKHGIIKQRFDVHIKNKKKCTKCPRVKKTYTVEYIENLISKRDIKYKAILNNDVYGVLDKITLICEKHGEFKQSIHNHFNIGNNCPKCIVRKPIEINEKFINQIEDNGIEVIKYNGYRKLSKFKCKSHGFFEKSVENVKKYGCTECYNEKRKNNNKIDFIKNSKAKWSHMIDFDYDNIIYNGMRSKMKIYSKSTGWIEQIAQNHLNGFLPKSSSGELVIKSILENLNINYIREKTFEDCKNVIKLRFDFYLPDINTCVEFNGIQHYKPIEFFGGIERYKSQIKNDNIKQKYCIDNNIKLIVISYKDCISEKINEILC